MAIGTPTGSLSATSEPPVRDDLEAMTEPRPSQVLGGLPRSRPHRRSRRRPGLQPNSRSGPARATTAGQSSGKVAIPEPKATTGAANPKPRARAVAKPRANVVPIDRAAATGKRTGAHPTTARPAPTSARRVPVARVAGTEVLGTAVQAAAELVEIGLTVGARTLRNALSRLPHS